MKGKQPQIDPTAKWTTRLGQRIKRGAQRRYAKTGLVISAGVVLVALIADLSSDRAET